MSKCSLSPYNLSEDVNQLYEIVNASKTIDLNFGEIDTKLNFSIPSDIKFNTDNINSELDSLNDYINNDINDYLKCLANKSQTEIFDSLKNTIPQIKDLLTLIPKINNLIPNIEKIHKFAPDNSKVNEFFDNIIKSIKTIEKYIAVLISSLILIISLIILLLAISTISLISLFVKNITSTYIIIIIIVYCILTFVLGNLLKNYIEKKLNENITNKLIMLKNEINILVNTIKNDVNQGIDVINRINSSGV